MLEKGGVPVLDLLPLFREGSRDRRLYWPRNTHWNAAGNRLAGQTLAEFLIESGRFPTNQHADR